MGAGGGVYFAWGLAEDNDLIFLKTVLSCNSVMRTFGGSLPQPAAAGGAWVCTIVARNALRQRELKRWWDLGIRELFKLERLVLLLASAFSGRFLLFFVRARGQTSLCLATCC